MCTNQEGVASPDTILYSATQVARPPDIRTEPHRAVKPGSSSAVHGTPDPYVFTAPEALVSSDPEVVTAGGRVGPAEAEALADGETPGDGVRRWCAAVGETLGGKAALCERWPIAKPTATAAPITKIAAPSSTILLTRERYARTASGSSKVCPVARVTVFGAGAMGTAMAMHSVRRGLDTALWATPRDAPALQTMHSEGRHPALPEHLPSELAVFPTEHLEEAARGCEIAVMAASSAGVRSLAKMVKGAVSGVELVVSVAKGLEEGSGRRPSEVYSQELLGATVIGVGGPCLASELARALPTIAVWACEDEGSARRAGSPFDNHHYRIAYTDDIVGVEFCAVIKNVAAIGLGLLDGLGKPLGEDYKNAKSALFSHALEELVTLVVALGGRQETARGLAGVGDALVTSLGGRNRLYGEMVGEGTDPKLALAEMTGRGMTVEGVDSSKHVHRLAGELGLDLPFHSTVYRTLLEGRDPKELLEVLF